jgi:tape measure domain-containing protein
MAVTAEQLNIVIAARDREFQRSLDRAVKSLQRFEGQTNSSLRGATTSINRFNRQASQGFDGMAVAVRGAAARITGAVAAISAVTGSLAGMIVAGDQLKMLEARFAAITGSGERAAGMMRGLLEVVERTGGSIEETAGAVARFRLAADQMGASDADVLRLTENVIKLGQIGGASGAEVASAMMQLSQALASGRLQGDELRSIMENMPLLARALADDLGVGVGALREMGSEGKLTSDVVFAALLRQSDKIAEAYTSIPDNIDRSTSRLKASFTLLLADLDQLVGASEKWVATLDFAADVIDKIRGFMNDEPQSSGRGSVLPPADGGTRTVPSTMIPWDQIKGFLTPEEAARREQVMGRLQAALDRTRQSTKEMNDETTETGRTLGANAPVVSAYEQHLTELQARLDELGIEMGQFDSINSSLKSSFEAAFMGIVDGTESVSDAFKGMARQVIAELYRVLVVQQLVGSLTGGGFLGSVGAALGIPAMAMGGSVQAGQPVITGEHGRELFVPAQDGRIMTAAQTRSMMAGGGGEIIVQQTINISTGVAQTVRAEIASMMPQIAAAAKNSVADAYRRGGAYGRALA